MSKGLEALEKLTEYLTGDYNDNVYEWLSEVEIALIALEIIKKRRLIGYSEIEDAIWTISYVHDLPQNEVDLLKEVLL